MDLINKYIEKFHELPPLIWLTSYKDEMYQKLFEEALKDNNKITKEKLDKYFKIYIGKNDIIK